MPKIVVHHLEASRSHRLTWLLEELELPYEVKHYARDPKSMRAPPELREVHPLGKSPVITVDELVLAESGAIIEEVLERFGEGRLRPAPGTPEAVAYRYWLHYAEGSLMSPLLVALIIGQVRNAPVPFFIKPVVKQIAAKVDASYTNDELRRQFGYIEQHLGTHTWFAGEQFTGADIQMSYPLEVGLGRARLEEGTPNIEAWLARTRARPAWQRGAETGGPPVSPG